MTDTETIYAVVAKEMLTIVFAQERWHQFTYGHLAVVNSDHKPLEAITKTSLDKIPKRLQGSLTRASAYDAEVKYMEGKKMFLAGTLRRAFLLAKNAQSQDESLQTLKRVVQQGLPRDKADASLSAS